MVLDHGDPLFSAWRIARIAHQLVTDPSPLRRQHLPSTAADADALGRDLPPGDARRAVLLAGVDPLLVANGPTMVAFPLCGLAFFYAAWRITDDPYAAIVGGLLGA